MPEKDDDDDLGTGVVFLVQEMKYIWLRPFFVYTLNIFQINCMGLTRVLK